MNKRPLLCMPAVCFAFNFISIPASADVDCTSYNNQRAACVEYSGPPKAPWQKADRFWYVCEWNPGGKKCLQKTSVEYYIYQHLDIFQAGDAGPSVSTIQQMLANKDYAVGVSGSFDLSTENAVKEFQNKAGLKVDGKVGKATLEALLK